MGFTDFALPILGFILVISSAYYLKKEEVTTKKIIELVAGFLIMGFSIWASIENSGKLDKISSTNSGLKLKLDEIIDKRMIDSNNNATFQKYLKDTFGIERQGDKPVKLYFNNTKNYFPTVQQIQTINGISDYIIYITPKEGSWVHAYFAFDTTQSSKFAEMLEEGMGTPNVVDKVTVNNKILNTHLIKIYDRAVYKGEPIKLNISAFKNGFIIFGEQGNPSKRYFYKNGKVRWIPN
jgi:hypothetical protein